MSIREEGKKKEEQWFLEHERALLKEMKTKREQRMKETVKKDEAERRETLRKLHWMHCPKCGHQMETKNLDGVSAEICSHCEGVYLDRDELEALIERRLAARRTIIGKLLGILEP